MHYLSSGKPEAYPLGSTESVGVRTFLPDYTSERLPEKGEKKTSVVPGIKRVGKVIQSLPTLKISDGQFLFGVIKEL